MPSEEGEIKTRRRFSFEKMPAVRDQNLAGKPAWFHPVYSTCFESRLTLHVRQKLQFRTLVDCQLSLFSDDLKSDKREQ